MKNHVASLILICACLNSQAQVTIITTIAGNGIGAFCCDGGPATNAEINNPDGLCIDKWGNIYVADPGNNRIRKIVPFTGIITTIAGKGIGGYSGDDSLATNAKLFIPDAVCTDTTGNIYITDPGNARIRKVTIATGIITTIAGNGTPGNSGDNGQATNAEISGPNGIYVEESGDIYIADINNNNIRKIAPNGIITTIAGIGTMGYTGDGGPATAAQFSAPAKAIVDNYGNIIIADGNNNVLREIGAETGLINTIAGNGTPGYSGDGGLAKNALLSNPYGICIDKQNNIFFAEYGNGTIRKIDGMTKIITTVAGCGIMGYAGDGGPATDAKLVPEDVTIDQYGVMYIADYENNRIRAVYNPKLKISNISLGNELVIYPNPAQSEITIENAGNCKMKIYNLLGQEMISRDFISKKESVNINSLIAGTYLINIVSPIGELHYSRFVKE